MQSSKNCSCCFFLSCTSKCGDVWSVESLLSNCFRLVNRALSRLTGRKIYGMCKECTAHTAVHFLHVSLVVCACELEGCFTVLRCLCALVKEFYGCCCVQPKTHQTLRSQSALPPSISAAEAAPFDSSKAGFYWEIRQIGRLN